ncbi:MAG: alanine transaminase [Deltaproteobacteria bacterium]|nr:alanine transaminase [Deltaproteobacteria bacterium]
MNYDFKRIERLPPYVFNAVGELKAQARSRGEDIIDFGMGNPDQGTPAHIVEKAIEAITKPANHRYSVSRGLYKLRLAACAWYKRKWDVELDADSEMICTMGAKEGLGHLVLSIAGPGDVVLCPSPTYPIHQYSVIIAGADLRHVPLIPGQDFFEALTEAIRETWPRPKALIVSFPSNPTTEVVELDFFEKLVELAREYNFLVIHDNAYAELTFDGYEAPSFLQVPGAREVGVECYTLSKTYNMPGWRVGFVAGNQQMVAALTRLKSYYDYGMFAPIQVAAIQALNGPQDCVEDIRQLYKQRRDSLCRGLSRIGWEVPPPQATMFVWAHIPEEFRPLGSMEFSKYLLAEGKVAVSPGIGFGPYGDEYVRFALIENEQRTRQAMRGIKKALEQGPDKAGSGS